MNWCCGLSCRTVVPNCRDLERFAVPPARSLLLPLPLRGFAMLPAPPRFLFEAAALACPPCATLPMRGDGGGSATPSNCPLCDCTLNTRARTHS